MSFVLQATARIFAKPFGQTTRVGRVFFSTQMICALHQLSYGFPSYLSDDLLDVSETTAALCLEDICPAVKAPFGFVYLRDPTPEDKLRIEREFQAAGFLGSIGCFDCSGWARNNCPKALQGIMMEKDGCTHGRMEVICTLNLWI